MFKKEHFSPGGKAGANPARSRRCVPDEPAIPPNFREGAEEDDGSQKTRGEKSRFDARGDSGRLPGDFFFAKKRRSKGGPPLAGRSADYDICRWEVGDIFDRGLSHVVAEVLPVGMSRIAIPFDGEDRFEASAVDEPLCHAAASGE